MKQKVCVVSLACLEDIKSKQHDAHGPEHVAGPPSTRLRHGRVDVSATGGTTASSAEIRKKAHEDTRCGRDRLPLRAPGSATSRLGVPSSTSVAHRGYGSRDAHTHTHCSDGERAIAAPSECVSLTTTGFPLTAFRTRCRFRLLWRKFPTARMGRHTSTTRTAPFRSQLASDE